MSELEAYKTELAREILSENNPVVLDAVRAALRGVSGFPTTYVAPGQMSVAEAKMRLHQSEQRFERGEYVSEKEMEEFYASLQ